MFCSVEGCGRDVYAKGFCVAHYFRERSGDLKPDVPVRDVATTRLCEIEGCEKKHYSRGMCQMHYKRWKRRGEPEKRFAPVGLRECSIEGCDKIASALGLCHGHYQRSRRNSALGDDVPLAHTKTESCVVDGCDQVQTPRTVFCKTHLKRRQRSGDVQADKPIRRVRGTGYVHRGYLYISVPIDERHLSNGRDTMQEHRLVMARHLGRSLLADESVHHINGNKLDNRIENLELWVRRQPSGQRIPDLLRYARELIDRYGEEFSM
jgi:hypothetical protein